MQHSADNNVENKHHHVIEIITYMTRRTSEFLMFDDVEHVLYDILEKYQNQYLNDFEEFRGNATIENIGEVLFRELSQAYDETGWLVTRLEIGETPLRVYAIVQERMNEITE